MGTWMKGKKSFSMPHDDDDDDEQRQWAAGNNKWPEKK